MSTFVTNYPDSHPELEPADLQWSAKTTANNPNPNPECSYEQLGN